MSTGLAGQPSIPGLCLSYWLTYDFSDIFDQLCLDLKERLLQPASVQMQH